MNFQVTVLKVLVSYPDGFAMMADLKRDMAILATSGCDWTERTKRLAGRVPELDIFSQGLVERLNGGWRITEKGCAVLEVMETRPAAVPARDPPPVRGIDEPSLAAAPEATPSIATDRRKQDRKRRRRALVRRGRAAAS
ncbi:hypothetical protein [uncultured Bradyrhizobium sp.]|uniref:hypothetical protein n=1 Tax=Bradyrhizobium sp. TaxID=376 RepID=UPI00261345AF|nr:hypothetical protein [uncultured Bradyrhizobium sp.]